MEHHTLNGTNNNPEDALMDDVKKLVMERLGSDATDEEIAQEVARCLEELRQELGKTASLKDCLLTLNKEELVSIAKVNGFRGYSKLRKDELVEFLQNALLDPAFMETVYPSLLVRELQLLKELCDMSIPLLSSDIVYNATDLLHYGICYFDASGKYLILPEELKPIFQSTITNQELEHQHIYNAIIYEVCAAAAYLYGVCPISVVQEHLQYEWHLPVDEQDIIDAVQWAHLQRDAIYFHKGYVISTTLRNAPEDIVALQQLQKQKKHFFWPDKERFSLLAINEWLVDDALYESFIAYVPYMMENEFGDIYAVARFVETSIRTGASFNALMGYLSEKIFMFESEEQIYSFAQTMQNIWNNTHMWENCGYTPLGERGLAMKKHPKLMSLQEEKEKRHRNKKSKNNKKKRK